MKKFWIIFVPVRESGGFGGWVLLVILIIIGIVGIVNQSGSGRGPARQVIVTATPTIYVTLDPQAQAIEATKTFISSYSVVQTITSRRPPECIETSKMKGILTQVAFNATDNYFSLVTEDGNKTYLLSWFFNSRTGLNQEYHCGNDVQEFNGKITYVRYGYFDQSGTASILHKVVRTDNQGIATYDFSSMTNDNSPVTLRSDDQSKWYSASNYQVTQTINWLGTTNGIAYVSPEKRFLVYQTTNGEINIAYQQ